MRVLLVFVTTSTLLATGLADSATPATPPSTQPFTRASLAPKPPPAPAGGIFGAIWGRRGRGGAPAGPSRSDALPEDLKSQLGCTDEEWKVINPLLRKVILAKRSVEPDLDNPMASRSAPSERFWESGDALVEAKKDLQAAIDDRNTPAEVLQEKVRVFREQRDKSRAMLKSAREDLCELLTIDQEELLVQLGYLE